MFRIRAGGYRESVRGFRSETSNRKGRSRSAFSCLTESQKAELDRRLDSYHRNPEAGSPWGLVREIIRKNL
ncbi:MAG TPA: hypothetical protein ENN17_05260 [bacterium]|nr:hypothetical protein [bacterium]